VSGNKVAYSVGVGGLIVGIALIVGFSSYLGNVTKPEGNKPFSCGADAFGQGSLCGLSQSEQLAMAQNKLTSYMRGDPEMGTPSIDVLFVNHTSMKLEVGIENRTCTQLSSEQVSEYHDKFVKLLGTDVPMHIFCTYFQRD